LLKAVVRAKETLVIDHPDQLALQHALVMAYQADKQVKKAVELLEHVVAVKGRFLRDNHPSRNPTFSKTILCDLHMCVFL
jgi:hypothetical protein